MQFRFLNLAAAASLAAAGSDGLRERELQNGQPSAKFAANWATDPIVASSCIGDIDGGIWGTSSLDLSICDGTEVNPAANDGTLMLQAAPLGAIKIPNDKEISITLSAQVDLFSVNTATSKKGKQDTFSGTIGATSTMAGVDVELHAVPVGGGDTVECAPGAVTMASRYVELRNQISGEVTYEDCFLVDGEKECFTKVADTELESTIGLALKTAAAHTFQWICPDMPSNAYNIKAVFKLYSAANDLCTSTDFTNCKALTPADLAAARVMLGSRVLTVQQVRAVKDSILELPQ